ncbi:MAG TPA: hypothetical protein VIJ92_13635 [Ginsengibacter sp.]
MKKFLIFFTIVNINCSLKKTLTITNLSPYSDSAIAPGYTAKHRYFLVKNYHYKDSSQFLQLKKYAFGHMDSDYRSFGIYVIDFFKESLTTNENYRQTHSDLIDYHSKDLIFDFYWHNGKYVTGEIYHGNNGYFKK